MVPGVTLPAYHLEQPLKPILWIALHQLSQCLDLQVIALGIGLVKINCPAQDKILHALRTLIEDIFFR